MTSRPAGAKDGDAHVFFGEELSYVAISAVEGRLTHGRTAAKVLVQGDNLLMFTVSKEAGGTSPTHAHDHESAGLILSGRLRTTIDGTSTEIGPGDGFVHPAGVPHHMEVIEDAIWLEVKAPPHQAWT